MERFRRKKVSVPRHVTVLSILIGLMLTMAACDPIKKYVNKHWPPLSSLDQSMRAVLFSAEIFDDMDNPVVGATIDADEIKNRLPPLILKKIKKAKTGDKIKKAKLSDVKVTTGKQEFRVSAKFHVRFKKPKAWIEGKILGVIAVSVVGDSVMLLPSFQTLTIDKAKYEGTGRWLRALGIGVDKIKNLINDVIEKYLNNINGQLAKPIVYKIKLPKVKPVKPKQLIKEKDGLTVKSGNKIKLDLYLGRSALMIDSDGVHLLAEIFDRPTTPTLPKIPVQKDTTQAQFNKAFAKYKGQFQKKWKQVLGSALQKKTEVLLAKVFLQERLNTAFESPNLCVSYAHPISTDDFSKEIEVLKPKHINCKGLYKPFAGWDCPGPSRYECEKPRWSCPRRPAGGCSVHIRTCRNCDGVSWRRKVQCKIERAACKVWNEKRRAELKICKEAKRAKERARQAWCKTKREAHIATHKAWCKTTREAKRVAHQLANEGRVAGCKTKREAIRNAYKFLKIGKIGGRLSGNGSVKACVHQIKFSNNLSKVGVNLSVDAKADTNAHIWFDPHNGGHLICVAKWKRDWKQTGRLNINPNPPREADLSPQPQPDGSLRMTLTTKAFGTKVKVFPPPIVQILKDPILMVNCLLPVVSGITFASVQLLRGKDIPEGMKTAFNGQHKFEVKSKQFSFDIKPAKIKLPVGSPLVLKPSWDDKTVGYRE